MTSSATAVAPGPEAARALLTRIRRVRTADQLDTVLLELLDFLVAQEAPLWQPGMHADGILSTPARPTNLQRLGFCSALAAAFARRAEFLVAARSLSGPAATSGELDLLMELEGRAASSDRAARAQQRRAALDRVRTSMDKLATSLEVLTAAAAKKHDDFSSSNGSCVDSAKHVVPLLGSSTAALTYGMGEVKDFSVHQRLRAVERLRGLVHTTPSAGWNLEAIAEAVWDISVFSPPTAALGATQRLLRSNSASRQRSQSPQPSLASAASAAAALEATRAVTPLRDPLSHALMITPCRGEACTHLDLFDAGSFVRAAQRRAVTYLPSAHEPGAACPLCRRFTPLHALRVDTMALAAMQAFTGSTGSGSPDAARVLTAEDCLEWDLADGGCAVVEGRQPHREGDGGGDGVGDSREGDQAPAGGGSPVSEPTIRKRRRVEIGGHVLFVDE